jgi:hypothetical protein
MHILKPIATSQDIVVVPRSYATSGITIELTDEDTNTTATLTPSVSNSDGYMTLSSIYSVKEGTFYTFKVILSSAIIYRGRVYCTSQIDLKQYTVNENEYVTENSYDNEFIVL